MFSYPHILWQKKNQKTLQTKPEPLIFHFMGNKLWYDAEVAGMDFPVYSVWDTESSCCHLIQENARKKNYGNKKISVEMHRVHRGKCSGLKPWRLNLLHHFDFHYKLVSLARLQGYSSHWGLWDNPFPVNIFPSVSLPSGTGDGWNKGRHSRTASEKTPRHSGVLASCP